MSTDTTKERLMRWSEICHALYMTGYMKDFSKAECLRVSKLLNGSLTASRESRGLYRSRFVPPDMNCEEYRRAYQPPQAD